MAAAEQGLTVYPPPKPQLAVDCALVRWPD